MWPRGCLARRMAGWSTFGGRASRQRGSRLRGEGRRPTLGPDGRVEGLARPDKVELTRVCQRNSLMANGNEDATAAIWATDWRSFAVSTFTFVAAY